MKRDGMTLEESIYVFLVEALLRKDLFCRDACKLSAGAAREAADVWRETEPTHEMPPATPLPSGSAEYDARLARRAARAT